MPLRNDCWDMYEATRIRDVCKAYNKKMCFFTRLISQLENREGKNSITNFPQNQAKPIEKVHNSSKQNKRNQKQKFEEK